MSNQKALIFIVVTGVFAFLSLCVMGGAIAYRLVGRNAESRKPDTAVERDKAEIARLKAEIRKMAADSRAEKPPAVQPVRKQEEKQPLQPKKEPVGQPVSQAWEVPTIEYTDDLKELRIEFQSWRVDNLQGTRIVGVVKPTKYVLERVSRYVGREIKLSIYDKNDLKLTGGNLTHPDLQIGESGEIRISLPFRYPCDKIGRIVLDKQ